jgi:hypothetical protein
MYAPETAVAAGQLVPRLSPRLSLTVVHKLADGALQPSRYTVRLDFPFVNEANVEPWVAYLLSACDGKRTLTGIYEQLLAEGVLTAAMTPREFWEIVRLLAVSGYLFLFSDSPGSEMTPD